MSSAPTEESALRGQEYNTLLCERFDPAQTLVGFYISNTAVSQDEWMNPLALELRRRGYAVVGLLAREAVGAARLDGTELTLELERGSVAALSRVQLFIVSDMEGVATDFPPRSRVLACAHSCIWCGSTNFANALREQAYFDGYLTSCPLTQSTRERVQALWTGFVPPSGCKRPSPHFYILASGYPRSAVLYHKLAELEGRVKRDAILYAPVAVDYRPSASGCRLERYGKRIVRCLLDSFPHLQLIFRPYRRDLEHPQVQALLTAFAHEPRFELDTDPQRAPAFSRAAVLVTDFSHIANSFAFTTLRPAVFFQPGEYVRNGRAFGTCPTGFYALTYQALIRAVRMGLESPGPCRELIRRQRERGMLPVESGLQDLAEQLDDFLRDRPRPEWISIERNNPSLTLGEAGIVKTIILSMPHGLEEIASATLHFFPESLFLTAFSLHMSLRHTPDQAVPGRLLANARRLLQEPPPIGDAPLLFRAVPTRLLARARRLLARVRRRLLQEPPPAPLLFRDVSPEIPRKLYDLAQLKAVRENDLELAGMTEKLKALL